MNVMKFDRNLLSGGIQHLDLQPVCTDDKSLVLPAVDAWLNGQTVRLPLRHCRLDIRHVETDMIHDGSDAASRGRILLLCDRDQHPRKFDHFPIGIGRYLLGWNSPKLDPEFLFGLHVTNVQMYVAHG